MSGSAGCSGSAGTTIGRSRAIADVETPLFGRLQFSGMPAWLFWLFVHIYFLIGFRNRLIVLTDWAWAYFSFERQARVVAESDATRGAPAGGEADGVAGGGRPPVRVCRVGPPPHGVLGRMASPRRRAGAPGDAGAARGWRENPCTFLRS